MELLYTLDRCPEARTRYQEYLKTNPNNSFLGEMDFVMASCLEEEGKLRAALKSFKALEGNYKYPKMVQMKLEGLQSRIKKNQPKKKRKKKRRSKRRRS